MLPQLALFLCVCLIAWLLGSDLRQRYATSRALWIPGAWLAINGSRPVSYWFGQGGDSNAAVDGILINTIIFGVLIFAAVFTLMRRDFNLSTFIQNNKALCLIYLFFALSAAWSPLGLTSLKRVVKDFGSVLMVLVLLTEYDPVSAIRAVFVRVSFLIFPLSVVSIKYFPDYGRMYSKGWEYMFTGVATHKNSLGEIVMVLLIMIVVDITHLFQEPAAKSLKWLLRIRYALLAMGAWLLIVCDSKTSLLCTVVGLSLLWIGRCVARMPSPAHAVSACLGTLALILGIEFMFNISHTVVSALGRETTLSGREEIWKMIKEQDINPVTGTGYLAFWDSPAARSYREEGNNSIVSTHNGYLEVYVDGGIIGVVLLGFLLLSAGGFIFRELCSGTLFGGARFALFLVILIHNWTESSFFRGGPVWFALVLIMVNQPCRFQDSSGEPASESEPETMDVEGIAEPVAQATQSLGSA